MRWLHEKKCDDRALNALCPRCRERIEQALNSNSLCIDIVVERRMAASSTPGGK